MTQSKLLLEKPTELSIIFDTHVHETNETRRKKQLLEQCRELLSARYADPKEQQQAVSLINQIDHALTVRWQVKTEHFTGWLDDPTNPFGRIPCVKEFRLGYYDKAHMDETLDALSVSPLTPEELFLPLVKAQNIAYKVYPVRWYRAANPDAVAGAPLTASNSRQETEEFPHLSVEFDTKNEAAEYMRNTFHLNHPGMIPRCILA